MVTSNGTFRVEAESIGKVLALKDQALFISRPVCVRVSKRRRLWAEIRLHYLQNASGQLVRQPLNAMTLHWTTEKLSHLPSEIALHTQDISLLRKATLRLDELVWPYLRCCSTHPGDETTVYPPRLPPNGAFEETGIPWFFPDAKDATPPSEHQRAIEIGGEA